MANGSMISSFRDALAAQAVLDQFAESSKSTGNSGRLILSKHRTSDLPGITVAQESFGERVLRFLSNLPYLKNTELVKSYSRQLKLENRNALAFFLEALSKRYNDEAGTVSFQTMRKEVGKKGLNARTIRKLVNIAERYAGLGESKTLPRNVAIHIWPYKSTAHPGHASVTIANKTAGKSAHISWWPDGKRHETSVEAGQSGSGEGLLARTQNLFAPHFGLNHKSVAQDIAREVGSADLKLQSGEEARAEIQARIDQGTWHRDPPLKAADVPEAMERIFRLRLAAAVESDPEISSKIKSKAADLRLEVTSLIVPRPTQIKDSATGKWGAVAEKVYLPMSGPQVSVGDDGVEIRKFALFGLSEQAMFADADDVKTNAQAYGEISKAAKDARNPQLQSKIPQARAKREALAKEITSRNGEISVLAESLHESKLARSALYERRAPIGELRHQEAKVAELENSLSRLHKENRHTLRELGKLEHQLSTLEVKLSPDSVARKEAEAETVGPEIGYQFASTTNNCAGMVIRTVRAGGADDFVPFTGVTDALSLTVSPDAKFTAYMIRLQKELDGLNARAEIVMSRLQVDAPVAEEELLTRQDLADFVSSASDDWVRVGDLDEEVYDLGIEGLQANLIDPEDSRSRVIDKMKNLLAIAEQVYALEDAASSASPKVHQLKARMNMAFNTYRKHVAP